MGLKEVLQEREQYYYMIIRGDAYLPAYSGEYMIITDDCQIVKAWINARKSIFTSLDGGESYDAVAWRTLVQGEK